MDLNSISVHKHAKKRTWPRFSLIIWLQWVDGVLGCLENMICSTGSVENTGNAQAMPRAQTSMHALASVELTRLV